MRECIACNYQLTEEEETLFDGTCPNCKRHIFFCDQCEEYFTQESFNNDYDLCDTCFDDLMAFCDECGEAYFVYGFGSTLCDDCLYKIENDEEK